MSHEHPPVTLYATVKGAGTVRVIISELMNPSLSMLVGLLYRDAGVPQPAEGYWLIPAGCATQLQELEYSAAHLSTTCFAPEDCDAAEAVSAGEAVRYVDCEMASFALGGEALSAEIARRIPYGAKLLSAVDCITEYLRERASRERDLCFRK